MSLSAFEDKLLSVLSGSSDPNGPGPAAFENSVRRFVRAEIKYDNLAAVTTTTNIAEITIGRVKQKSRLVGAWVVPAAAFTGNAGNTFTVALGRRAVALPGTLVTMVSYLADQTPADDLTAWLAKDLFVLGNQTAGGYLSNTATDLNCGEGDAITFSMTKTGSATFPACTVVMQFEPRD